jgi:hypothetical protein
MSYESAEVSRVGPPHVVAFYDTLGDAENLSFIRVEMQVGMWNFLDKIIFKIFAHFSFLLDV